MKEYFEVIFHGDSDIAVDGEIIEQVSIYCREISTCISEVEKFAKKDISPSYPGKEKCPSFFKKALKSMVLKLKSIEKGRSLGYDFFMPVSFGGNQYVKVDLCCCPDDKDFCD